MDVHARAKRRHRVAIGCSVSASTRIPPRSTKVGAESGCDVAEAKDNGYRAPLSGIWRRVLNIVMVLTNCTQTDIAAFCGFAQSSLSLWVNGKYAGDTRALLAKFKEWVETTYPELGA